MFDVVIAGAGPAGTIAAIVLARAGVRVCLVERERFPRPKLCGDTLNPAALAILSRLHLSGVADGALALDGMRVTGEGVAIDARYPRPLVGAAIARERFDAALLDAALAAGVDVRDGLSVRRCLPAGGDDGSAGGVVCTARNGARIDIPARVTVAADGRRSTLAFSRGLARHPRTPRRWAIGAHAAGVGRLSSYGEMHIRRDHYIGVAPLPGALANVCMVRSFAAAGTLGDPAAMLMAAVRADPDLRERFAGAELVSKPIVLGPLAVDVAGGAAVPEGLLLAGDAAGFIDPMTGDGLRFALRGGELAALAAMRALGHGWRGVHAWHDRQRTREFGPKWRFNRMLRGLVGSPLGVRGAALGGWIAPAVVRALIRRAGDCHAAATA
jgi:flavin-dependent dehydrogenase